jgi:hypothetical protein
MFIFCRSNKKEECFICCSVDGKTDNEKIYEIYCNQKYCDYPLIQLSNAYDCNCSTSYAHNKCLFDIKKCPTCRKVVTKPKLYVSTRYDYYLWFLFDWIKKDISRIEKIKYYAILCLIIMCSILCLFDKNKNIIDLIIPPKSLRSLFFGIVMGGLYFISMYIIILDDYFTKYWLYDSKIKKSHIL